MRVEIIMYEINNVNCIQDIHQQYFLFQISFYWYSYAY